VLRRITTGCGVHWTLPTRENGETVSSVPTRQRLASVAAFLSLTKESNTIPVPQPITTDSGVHWILLTKEIGEIVFSVCRRQRVVSVAAFLSLTIE